VIDVAMDHLLQRLGAPWQEVLNSAEWEADEWRVIDRS
jgi:hypothetical protein